jgi:hypothetical protein
VAADEFFEGGIDTRVPILGDKLFIGSCGRQGSSRAPSKLF